MYSWLLRDTFVVFLLLFCPLNTYADLMTVKDLKVMIASGDAGKSAAIGYVQGVVEGMIGMDSLYHKEKGLPYEFCKLHPLSNPKVKTIEHPAFQTEKIVNAWENQKQPMETQAVDMILMWLTGSYGC